jgi:hypothetical protein
MDVASAVGLTSKDALTQFEGAGRRPQLRLSVVVVSPYEGGGYSNEE